MNLQQAQQIEQQAKNEIDKTKARALYLDAAELYLRLSKNDKANEKLRISLVGEIRVSISYFPATEARSAAIFFFFLTKLHISSTSTGVSLSS